MTDNNFQYSKKGERKLSKFFARGLLYDFVENKLDEERKSAIHSTVQEHPDLQQEAEKIKLGLDIAKDLSMVSVSEELLKKVTISSSYFYSIRENLNIDKWSPALKLGIEGSVIALGIAVMAIIIPWNSLLDINIGPQEIVLSEITKSTEVTEVSEVAASQKESLEYPDDQNLQKNTEPPPAEVPSVAQPSPTATSVIATDNPAVPAKPPVAAITQVQIPTKVEPNTEKLAASTTSEKRSGFLYRGTVYVTNLKATTPKLVEKVQELGGRKAGQVELGWYKGDSSYFHFTMPDNKYQELEGFFSTYGALSIQREQHERVMPDGIRRIIITVYEKK